MHKKYLFQMIKLEFPLVKDISLESELNDFSVYGLSIKTKRNVILAVAYGLGSVEQEESSDSDFSSIGVRVGYIKKQTLKKVN